MQSRSNVPQQLQQLAMPVIGFLGSATPELYSERLRNFRRGLQEEGYVEGQNVAMNIAGQKTKTSAYRSSRLNWFAGSSPCW